MTEADRVHSTPPLNSSSSDLQFKTLAEAEAFLQSQGFRLVPDSCDWTNDAGDDAGCYSIEDGHYGEVKGFRVEINRRSPKPAEGLSRRLMLAGLAAAGIPATLSVALPAAAAEPDPIFTAIEAHRKAAAVAKVAFAEVDRLVELADETVGPLSISVLDMREPSDPPGWHPYADAELVSDIWELVPGEENKDLRDHYLEKLAERQAAWMAITGNTDEITDEPCGALWAAIDQFADTVPTTRAGLFAKLFYAAEIISEHKADAFRDPEELIVSMAAAAKTLIGRAA